MRHKVLIALQNLLGQEPVLFSSIAEFNETFVLDCYKGAPVLERAGRKARKHGAKAVKCGILNEYVANCTVVDANHESCRGLFNLNTVNSLHSYIKETYNHYRGVATKYINRYNALFSIAFRPADNLKDTQSAVLCNVGQKNYWHSVKDVRNYQLVML